MLMESTENVAHVRKVLTQSGDTRWILPRTLPRYFLILLPGKSFQLVVDSLVGHASNGLQGDRDRRGMDLGSSGLRFDRGLVRSETPALQARDRVEDHRTG